MKKLLIQIVFVTISISCFAQMNTSFIYSPKSCPGEKVDAVIHVDPFVYGDFEFCFKGSNIPKLKAFMDGKELDTTSIHNISNQKSFTIEFIIPDEIEGAEVYYTVKKDENTYIEKVSVLLSAYQVNARQSYIQTTNSCSEQVKLVFPFYGTSTDISLYDITDGTSKKITRLSYMCCYSGNTFSMPKNIKGKFIVKAYGCHISDSFEFEVNTLSN